MKPCAILLPAQKMLAPRMCSRLGGTMKHRTLKIMLGVMALIGALGHASAMPILVGTTTTPTGVNGLVVGGVTYDLTFGSSFVSSPFSFGTADGQAASAALAQALNDLSVVGLNGVTCEPVPAGPLCALYVDEPGVSGEADAARIGFTTSWESFPTCIVGAPGCGVSQGLFVDWTVEGTVPEPATVALLGLSLAGIGFARRRAR